LHHAWQGSPQQCEAAKEYFKQLAVRREQEAKNLADLTGWELDTIRGKMNLNNNQIWENGETPAVNAPKNPPKKSWWKSIW
jgi:hypothetical protein